MTKRAGHRFLLQAWVELSNLDPKIYESATVVVPLQFPLSGPVFDLSDIAQKRPVENRQSTVQHHKAVVPSVQSTTSVVQLRPVQNIKEANQLISAENPSKTQYFTRRTCMENIRICEDFSMKNSCNYYFFVKI